MRTFRYGREKYMLELAQKPTINATNVNASTDSV